MVNLRLGWQSDISFSHQMRGHQDGARLLQPPRGRRAAAPQVSRAPPGTRTFALDSDAWRTRPTRSSAATCARNSSLSSPSQRVTRLRLRGSALDEGKAKVTALRFKLAVTQALNTLFGEVGAALPVDLLGFDEPKQEAILRLPSKCAPACMHVHVHHTCTTPGNHGTRSRARLWSALMLITDFEKKPCRVQVLAVAGTLSQLSGSPEWPRAHAGHRRPPGLPASPPHLATA